MIPAPTYGPPSVVIASAIIDWITAGALGLMVALAVLVALLGPSRGGRHDDD